ncbi:hypothetical protein [Hydrogenimonas sp.]
MQFTGLPLKQKLFNIIDSSRAKWYIDLELYRLKRYGIPATIVMYRPVDPLFEKKHKIHSRRTDHVIPLTENHFLLVYSNTELSDTVKALDNLRIHLEHGQENEKNRIAMTQLREDDEPDDAIKRLLNLYVVAIQSEERIVDDTYLG